ncbi:hypothetical protein [Chryseobacterium lineare]
MKSNILEFLNENKRKIAKTISIMAKNIITFSVIAIGLFSCTDETLQLNDADQKYGEVNIKGYSNPDLLQLRFNGEPVVIGGATSYTNNILTQLKFVLDNGENNLLGIYNSNTGKEIKTFNINYDNIDQYKTINFISLPTIFLQTSVTKPTVNLGRVGFEFIFPNLGEFSGSSLQNVKGILKRESSGAVLATYDNIGKNTFTELKPTITYFTGNVLLELYKPNSLDPYAGTPLITVKMSTAYINNNRAKLIVLQEVMENGMWTVKGDIDIAPYL